MVKAVVGINWGDEGKGRMVDYFAAKADIVIRYQGGDNAGHTVVNEHGKFAFHCLPSGVCYPGVVNVIAPGSVLNPISFLKEVDETEAMGIKLNNLFISDRTTLIMPYHKEEEALEEKRLKDKKYGSTMSGIAPSYSDKYAKKGIQAGELFYPEKLKEHIKDIIAYKNIVVAGGYKGKEFDADEIYNNLMAMAERLKPYIIDLVPYMRKAENEGKNIIVEAQLGALRDITHGIYPYTTSSSVLAGYACASVPLAPKSLESVVGITKAYSTCVGEGPFISELFDATGDKIREIGHEYGAKTGRPRRIGWFDAVATRYGCQLQATDEMVVTCLDVLTGLDELKICTHYDVNGSRSDVFPINPALVEAKPVYMTVKGWTEDITGVRSFEELPKAAQEYIRVIEKLTETKISYVSVGPERDALIQM